MSTITSIELLPSTNDSARAGVILKRGDQRTTLWFGEATYDDVYAASGQQVGYTPPGEVEMPYTRWEIFPIYSVLRDVEKLTFSHYYYFDEHRRLQAVDIHPVDDFSIRIAGIEAYSMYQTGLHVFGVSVPKLRRILDEYLSGEITEVGNFVLYRNAGLIVTGHSRAHEVSASLSLISQDWFERLIESRRQEIFEFSLMERPEPFNFEVKLITSPESSIF
jgi:hypothetical protein